MTVAPTVFVVDDDETVRNFMRMLIQPTGIRMEAHSTADEFLDVYDSSRPGCLVVDVRLPGMSGIELYDRLRTMKSEIPVIVITGYGDVGMAVQAMKRGAFDFFQKPFDGQTVLQRVREALKLDASRREERARRKVIVERAKRLTPREREVMGMVVSGLPNKTVAVRLQVSQKTVEAHRASAMRKMEASSLPDLVRYAEMVSESPEDAVRSLAGNGRNSGQGLIPT